MSQIADPAHLEAQSRTETPISLPWIERLVSIDTVSRNPNLGLIETVRDELRKSGIPLSKKTLSRLKVVRNATRKAAMAHAGAWIKELRSIKRSRKTAGPKSPRRNKT